MRLSLHTIRSTLLGLAVAAMAASAGCLDIANMDDLKETLGANVYVAPAPDPLPPVAVLTASATQAKVGEAVQFSAEGSEDPQLDPLSYHWNLGDGTTSEGARVTHAYKAEGSYVVTLTVKNVAGLVANATHAIVVYQTNLPPVAAFTIATLQGAETDSVDVNTVLEFTPAGSSDPEASALTYYWQFGDGSSASCDQAGCQSGAGTTSTAAEPRHTYTAPGRYAVILTVTDDHGHIARATREVGVNTNWTTTGKVSMAAPAWERSFFTNLPETLNVTIGFQSASGTESITLTLKDAASRTVANTTTVSALGETGPVTRSIVLPHDVIAQHGKGDWSIVIVRENGLALEVPFTVQVTQVY